jgi:hypothetical protein
MTKLKDILFLIDTLKIFLLFIKLFIQSLIFFKQLCTAGLMMVWEMKFYVLFEQNPRERKVGERTTV